MKTQQHTQSVDRASTRQERINDLVKGLEVGVAAIQSTEEFKQWLMVASRFHNYSFTNQLLIAMQRPNATRVAGYKTWQSLGRQVKRGEKAISILAPRPYTRENKDGDGEEIISGLSFVTVSVFDLSQTEGDPLPEVGVALVTGDEGDELYDALLKVAAVENLEVTNFDNLTEGEDHKSTYNGYYNQTARRIFVKSSSSSLSPSHMAKTLAHELGHHFDLMLTDQTAITTTTSKEEKETVAEAVAYCVAMSAGLDTTGYSFPYIAIWAGRQDGPTVIRRVMERIQSAAERILSQLDSQEQTPNSQQSYYQYRQHEATAA